MGRTHLVVDGSNIATEGRTAPSLAQLDEAVRAFLEQNVYAQTTVIVDATFGHRIDANEVESFEEALRANEVITPPAGTIGRGDAFILQVARQADADVLSNDSFQELHAEHPWLFETGRLWGGKPVPAVGWVFVPRAPVRGMTSRKVVHAAKKAAAKKAAATKAAATKAAVAKPAATKPAARGKADVRPEATRPKQRAREATEPVDGKRPRKGRSGSRLPVNPQLVYASFVIEHPIGSTVTGVVDRFSSHGAYIGLGNAVGYVPLKSLGDPPPRSAREVLKVGEERAFRVDRFDPTTRGIDVVPADVSAVPTSAGRLRADQAAAATATAGSTAPDAEEAPVSPVAKKASARKASAKKATARKATAKKATARKATARKATARKAPARKATARKATARKTAARKAPARKAAAKKTAAKKAPAKRATARKTAARKAPARKATAKKR